MYNYKGISAETINLLCENKFSDSKDFYEEHKEALKNGAIVPMRQLVLDLSEDLCDVDSNMYLNPIYIVSRIRRDTRRSNNKTMYRENLWVMFRRNKKEFPSAPFMWFEFTPLGYSYGIGLWCQKPAQMDEIRKIIADKPKAFLKAAKILENDGFVYSADIYKKDRKPELDEKLKKYYNARYFQFMHFDSGLSKINNDSLVDELKAFIKKATPMYNLLIEGYENMIKEGLIKYE